MNEDRHRSGAPWRNFHGRLKGKALRPRQEEMLRDDLGALSPGAVSWDENPGRAPLDLGARFPGREEVWLEIGFGGGEHMVAMAAAHPQVALIGAEPYINGVAMLLGKIRDAGVDNVAVHPGDVRDLFDVLPEASISRAFLNYPDPWPKARHHKRRFVTAGHLQPLYRVLRPGALFRVATDIEDYVRQTLEEVPAAGFERVPQDIHRAWPDWPGTRYEAKALREGRPPHYLTFRKPAAAE
ncbi:tRNA (guanine(46)-N(7))-methyltransferase TrmB [Wenxinia saemankumensis]|uniref:tRNA (guanine-N(7)-)-methyltransferase n=1 Tax=Wenxinia saemankumensis TaxID=1447782 RepID=A0A1M6E884_9RHOB|nr:tRNA (guanine(46)-N(7))-methyltransferase TrmB [Wenxinia saemankumensis]SHI81508.1 tRNA (guanine-N(7)-)-methyltransferase [Wenxinia saemankumensis]